MSRLDCSGPQTQLTPDMARVYIVIVNWNGWRDTIECLESLQRLRFPSFTTVVCDNASPDGSLTHIRSWASGTINAACNNPDLLPLTTPPAPKPLPFLEFHATAIPEAHPDSGPLVFIDTGANLGFAGACNLGMRYALADRECEYVWLLNNDTVVDPDALSALVCRLENLANAGACGSTLVYYDDIGTIQLLGGATYNPWVARAKHIGKYLPRGCSLPVVADVEAKMGYVAGASMLVSAQFVRSVGWMNEAYFLYFEEIDWATRAKGRFSLAYAPKSVVYHKEGRTIGSGKTTLSQSPLSEFYGARNRLLFTSAFFPFALPSVALAMTLSALHRLVHGHTRNFSALLRGAWSALGCMRSFRAQCHLHGKTSPTTGAGFWNDTIERYE